MSEVYTMPYVFRNTLLAAVLMTLGVGNLTAGVAQVVGTERVPIEACAAQQKTFQVGNQPWPCERPKLWLSLSSIRATLEPKGVKFSQPKGSPAQGGMIWMRFPGTDFDVTLSPEQQYGLITESGERKTFKINPDFIAASDFMSSLFVTPLPVSVTGWDNAEIRVGETRFTLGNAQQPVTGKAFYNDVISKGLIEYLFPSLIKSRAIDQREDALILTTFENAFVPKFDSAVAYQHTIQIKNAKPGEVYIVLSREGPTNIFSGEKTEEIVQNIRRAFITPVAADGTIKYISPSKTINVSSDTNLARGVIDGAGTISVLRFTGRIDVGNPNNVVKVPTADVTVSQ
jgi:hypothetical protein